MRDIYIYLNEKLDKERCFNALKEHFPEHHFKVNSNEQIFIGFYPNNFAINFEDWTNIDDIVCDDIEAYKKTIPESHQHHCFWFQYNLPKVARKVIKLLMSEYPNMFIYDNDFEWCGYAKDYINSKHQENK